MSGPHPSHVTRFSDASTYDEICVNCGATDEVHGGWGELANSCPKQRRFRYFEPGKDGVTPVECIFTESQILEEYYPYWKTQMEKVGKSQHVSDANCIEDWMVIHWAEELSS